MKTVRRVIFLAVVVSTLAIAGGFGVVAAADPKGDPKSAQPGMDADAMNKMMALATPGEHHKAMDKMVGTWKTSIKMWMGPGQPEASTGTATYQWILGGRYMQEKQTATMSGMPFEGMGITGYDNAKNQYFNVWLDNMGTGVMNSIGHASADGKGITFTGTTFDPMQNKDVSVREEISWQDDTHFTFSMYMPMPAAGGQMQDMKVMEIASEKQ
jgi:hypothetical protein